MIQTNPLLDAICYLGMRANGNSLMQGVEQLIKDFPKQREEITELSEPYLRLEALLDGIEAEGERLERFFKRFPGVVDRYSPYGHPAGCIMGCVALKDAPATAAGAVRIIKDLAVDERLYNVLQTGITPVMFTYVHNEAEFSAAVDALPVADSYKWRISQLYYSLDRQAEELAEFIEPFVTAIRENFTEEFGFDFGSADESYARKRAEELATKRLSHPQVTPDKITVRFSCMMYDHMYMATVLEDGKFDPFVPLMLYMNMGLMCRYKAGLKTVELSPDGAVSMLKALSDKSRYDILCALREREMFGKELAEELELSPATISQHINKLSAEGLIKGNLRTRCVYYSLNRERFTALIKCMAKSFLSCDVTFNEAKEETKE